MKMKTVTVQLQNQLCLKPFTQILHLFYVLSHFMHLKS